MSEKITHLTAETFDGVIDSKDIPVLIDFWAPWCGPCRALGPILEEISSEFEGRLKICKINVDEQPDLASRYNVRGIPALFVFKNGQVIDQFVGLMSKGALKTKLEGYVQ